MATIQPRKKKKGISYTATIRIVGHPTMSMTFDRKTDAEEWAKRKESKIKEGINFPTRKLQKQTVNDIIDKFIELELPKKKEKAQKEFKRALEWFRAEIGRLYVRNVTSVVMYDCRAKLEKKHKEKPTKKAKKEFSEKLISPATVNRYLECMSVVFNYAKNKLDIIDINPMDKVDKLAENNARVRYLELEEINRLLTACLNTRYDLYLCVLIALLTGARKSEILNLTWENVDFDNKMFYFMRTKNGTNRGTPIHEHLCDELLKFKNDSKVRSLKQDYVFRTESGKPHEYLIGKLFPIVVEKIGITDFRFHDLRHTHASYQAMGGKSQITLQNTLGHKSLAMTVRYSHLSENSLRKPINETGDTLLQEFIKSKEKKV